MASRSSSRRNCALQEATTSSNRSSRRNGAVQSQTTGNGSPRHGSIVPAVQSLSLHPSATQVYDLPRRKGLGTLGEKVVALTNHFSVDISNMATILEYSLTVKERDQADAFVGGLVRRRVIQLLLLTSDKMRHAASDYQSKLISTTELTPPGTAAYTYSISYYGEEENGPRSGDDQVWYTILVQRSQSLDTDGFRRYLAAKNHSFADRVQDCLTAINLMFSRFPNQAQDITTAARGTKYFETSTQNGRVDLTYGLDAYKGSFRSARSSRRGLILNVNTTAGAFLKEGRLDLVMAELESSGRNHKSVIDKLEGYLKFIRVRSSYGKGRAKSIYGIPRSSNKMACTGADISFPRAYQADSPHLAAVNNITGNRHFQEAYPDVQRHNLQSFVVDVGLPGKPVFVPSDLLYILPGQAFRGFLPHSDQTTNMINFACRKPSANIKLINTDSLNHLGIRSSGGPHERFGLQVNTQMLEVAARMLLGPQVWDKSRKPDKQASTGDWNLQNKKFPKTTARPLVKYTLLELLSPGMHPTNNLNRFIEEVNKGMSSYCGFQNAQFEVIPGVNRTMPWPSTMNDPKQAFATLFGKFKSHDISLLFVVLPNYSAQNYHEIKYAGDVLAGLLTICTVRKGSMVKASVGAVANLMLKFNLKHGGENLQMRTDVHALLSKRTMFVGADVSHPSPGSMKESPSIAAVVSTLDDQYSRYVGRVGLQRSKNESKQALEMIANLHDMLTALLEHWKAKNGGSLPEQVIIYRDGVSDGQYPLVISGELPPIRRACERVYGNLPKPKLLLLTVQKRHHVRFYKPEHVKTSKHFDANGNPLPGFGVDGEITSERFNDWYCTSHKCLQGTSRPAKYVVLHDSIDVNPDQLQLLTHHMCWLFGRATKSISVHPAARYADLLCDRARVYLRPVFAPEPERREEVYTPNGEFWAGRVHADLQNTLFFA